MAILFSSLTLAEEKPDIKLPEISIIGKDKSKVQEKIKPEKTIIKIEEESSLTKDSAKEPTIEIDLPSIEDKFTIEDKSTILREKSLTSSFTISGGNYSSLKYQYLYGQKIKEANLLFIIERNKSGGFIVDNQKYNKHSEDRISLNLDLPLKIPNLEKEFFLSTEAKYRENEEYLPFNQNKEIIKDLNFSLKSRHFKVWNTKLNSVLTNTKTKLIHENIDKKESNYIDFDTHFYTDTKKYFSKVYPLNVNLKIQRATIENIKQWNYLIFTESNNIEKKDYTINIRTNYHNYNGASTLGFKLDIFYPYRKNIKIFTTLKRKAELPTFSKIYGSEKYVEASSYYPQKLNYGEGGLRYQIKDDFLISSFVFVKRAKDFISWRDANSNQLYEPFNISRVKISGLGFKVKKELSPHITYGGDLIFNSSIKNKAPGQKVPFIPKEEIKTNLKIVDFKGMDVEFVGTYKGSRYAYYDQNVKLKSFLLLGFNIYKNIDNHLHLFISGDNIFNREYQIRPGYFGDLATINAGITIKI